MPFCHECGAAAIAGASFCGGCGAALISVSDAATPSMDHPAPPMDLASATPAPDGPTPSVAAYDDTETPDLDITLVGHNVPDIYPEPEPVPEEPDDDFATVVRAEPPRGLETPAVAQHATPDEVPAEDRAANSPLATGSVIAGEPATAEEPFTDSPAYAAAVPELAPTPEPVAAESLEEAGRVTDEDLAAAAREVRPETNEVEAPVEVAAAAPVAELPEPSLPFETSEPPVPLGASIPISPSAAVNLDATASSDRPRTSNQLKEGTVLNGRYEIVRRVGGGGMGAVYLAKDRHLGDAPRAVKEMIQAHLDESQQEKAVGDFKRESLLLTSLEHPAIPTIYDYFYDEAAARFYLVMKYISGGDFAARMRNAPAGRIDEKTATQWAIEVTDVLEYLHNRRPQIIYRDLKPANLMIDGNSGRVMLIDFGIARWVNKEEKGVTAVGTMGYAPPELFSGKVEPRSDVYSLGATMFHMLTGADPQDNPLLIFDFGKHPRPRVINPAISVEMEHILMKAVEYKPEDRFHSAGEMGDVLGLHLERLRNGAVTYGPVAGAVPGAPVADTVFCGLCGGRIAAEDYFCAHCGAQQPLAGAGAGVPLTPGRATAKLVLAGTTELEYPAFVLQKDSSLVGRSDPQSNNFPEIDLTRFDPQTKVSRRHARIWRKGEMFLIEDLGSVNGTVLFSRGNDTIRLAPHQPRVLENGDRLRLGETMLNFVVG